MSALALEVDASTLMPGDVLRDESVVTTRPIVNGPTVTATVRHANGVLGIRYFSVGGPLVRIARPIVWPSDLPDLRDLPYDPPYDGPLPDDR